MIIRIAHWFLVVIICNSVILGACIGSIITVFLVAKDMRNYKQELEEKNQHYRTKAKDAIETAARVIDSYTERTKQ